MESKIRIDFIDRGTGKGIEPVIKVEIKNSEDPRDTLVSHLFQSLSGQSYLQLHYTNHQHTLTADSLPDMEKTVLLFKPEINTDELMSIVRLSFCEWALNKGWSAVYVELENKTIYANKKKETVSEEVLFSQFVSEKATHSS